MNKFHGYNYICINNILPNELNNLFVIGLTAMGEANQKTDNTSDKVDVFDVLLSPILHLSR